MIGLYPTPEAAGPPPAALAGMEEEEEERILINRMEGPTAGVPTASTDEDGQLQRSVKAAEDQPYAPGR